MFIYSTQYEAMHMIRKGQIRRPDKGNIKAQNQFIAGLFGLAISVGACRFVYSCLSAMKQNFLQQSRNVAT